MNRLARTDATLNALNDERDHLAIQISLLADTDAPEPARLSALHRKLEMVEHRISHYRPVDA
jgi:hypothetical protein